MHRQLLNRFECRARQWSVGRGRPERARLLAGQKYNRWHPRRLERFQRWLAWGSGLSQNLRIARDGHVGLERE
jgi:hypothetical protein